MAGPATAGLAVGEEVFGLTDQLRDGAAAEFVAVEARNVAPKPRTLDHIKAAAVPRAGLTAWQGLFDHGKLANGQTVVIHGAGGAGGSTAVQLARWAGAEVVGTGRGSQRSLVTELGADRFIALDADRLQDAAGQAHLVLDTIGGEVSMRGTCARRSARCTRSRTRPGHTARRRRAACPAGSSSSPDRTGQEPDPCCRRLAKARTWSSGARQYATMSPQSRSASGDSSTAPAVSARA